MAKSALLEPIPTLEGVKIGPYFVANLGQCMVKTKKNLMAKSTPYPNGKCLSLVQDKEKKLR